MKIKGVILAGGNGKRMRPFTKICSKHLLPVGGKLMLQHSVEKLVEAGIDEIMIVTGGEHLGAIAEFFGSGKYFDCHFTYRVQDRAGGIAEALDLVNGFVKEGEHMCVILGDNVFEDSLIGPTLYYTLAQKGEYPPAAMVMLKEVDDPERFGVAQVSIKYGLSESRCFENLAAMTAFRKSCCAGEKNGILVIHEIQEKPKEPKSNFAVTGVYFYYSDVFEITKNLKPSGRGELEITDVNNEYIRRKAMTCEFWDGWWTDAGTLESYRRANELAWEQAD